MKITLDKLPYADFKALGLDEKAVLNLPLPVLHSLLSGNRTSLIRFENVPIKGLATTVPLDARLSVIEKDGKFRLSLHPIQPELKNRFDLSEKEFQHLQKNEMSCIPKLVSGKDGKLVEGLIMLDKSTNELAAIERDKLKAPDQINNVALTQDQKRAFVSGKPVIIDGKPYRLDPSSDIGLSGPNLRNVKIGHSAYGSQHLLLDLALLTAGAGHFVLLYHLANVLLHSKFKLYDPQKSLQDLKFRNALTEVKNDLLQKQEYLSKLPSDKKDEAIITTIENKAGPHATKMREAETMLSMEAAPALNSQDRGAGQTGDLQQERASNRYMRM